MREKRILKNLTIALVIVGLAVMLLPSMATATTSCINCSNGVSTKANTIYGTPVPLSQDSKLTASGYAAADVGMRNLGYGTININLPAGSTIQKAYLYWSVINNSESPSLATGTINSKPITGTLIATTRNPCWTGQIYN